MILTCFTTCRQEIFQRENKGFSNRGISFLLYKYLISLKKKCIIAAIRAREHNTLMKIDILSLPDFLINSYRFFQQRLLD